MKTRIYPIDLVQEINLPEYGIEVRYSIDTLSAIFYSGKKMRKDWYYKFNSANRMMEKINESIAQVKQLKDSKKKEREDVIASESFKVGDIIVNSWGYEQTNIDFHVVTAVLNKKIRVAAIGKQYTEDGFMSGKSVPLVDKVIPNSEFLLTVKKRGDYVYLTGRANYYCFFKWDGRPQYESHYA